MSLERLDVLRLRNISRTTFKPATGLNLIVGENGSGKTSLLESIYFLASSRSFRSATLEPMIQRGEPDCVVTARISRALQLYQVGVSRTRLGARDIKINGERVKRASELAQLIPTLLLGPETLDLLLGAPGKRRRFLNWGMFHVEPTFGKLWEDANRALRQRNLLLRANKAERKELETWTRQLVDYSDKLHSARLQYIRLYQPRFEAVVAELTQLSGVAFQYHAGWEGALSEVYKKDTDLDLKRGFSGRGFQRADVRITVYGQPAIKVCSRGELKSLVWSMVLAQGAMVDAIEHHETLYLIDDLASEFDLAHRRRMCEYLARTGHQVLLTGVDIDSLVESCAGAAKTVFHVKHGSVYDEVRVQEN